MNIGVSNKEQERIAEIEKDKIDVRHLSDKKLVAKNRRILKNKFRGIML